MRLKSLKTTALDSLSLLENFTSFTDTNSKSKKISKKAGYVYSFMVTHKRNAVVKDRRVPESRT